MALAAVALFYGINYFVTKTVFEAGLSSFAVMAIRSMITATFFGVYHQLAVKEKLRERKDFYRLLVAAIFGVSINQTFYLWGMSQTSRVNAAVLMILTPVFVFLAAWLLREERFSWRKVIGLLVSFLGAGGLILAGSKDGLQGSGATIAGDVMIMINAASYGIYLVLVRPLVQRYNTFTIIKWIFLLGSLPNIALGLMPLVETPSSKFTPSVIGSIAFLIVFATIFAYALNAWAMKRLPSSAVGIYIYVQPVFVTLVSALFGLGEIGWVTVPFIFLIFAGVWLVSWSHPPTVPTASQDRGEM